eukprot:ctg_235.g137
MARPPPLAPHERRSAFPPPAAARDRPSDNPSTRCRRAEKPHTAPATGRRTGGACGHSARPHRTHLARPRLPAPPLGRTNPRAPDRWPCSRRPHPPRCSRGARAPHRTASCAEHWRTIPLHRRPTSHGRGAPVPWPYRRPELGTAVADPATGVAFAPAPANVSPVAWRLESVARPLCRLGTSIRPGASPALHAGLRKLSRAACRTTSVQTAVPVQPHEAGDRGEDCTLPGLVLQQGAIPLRTHTADVHGALCGESAVPGRLAQRQRPGAAARGGGQGLRCTRSTGTAAAGADFSCGSHGRRTAAATAADRLTRRGSGCGTLSRFG